MSALMMAFQIAKLGDAAASVIMRIVNLVREHDEHARRVILDAALAIAEEEAIKQARRKK